MYKTIKHFIQLWVIKISVLYIKLQLSLYLSLPLREQFGVHFIKYWHIRFGNNWEVTQMPSIRISWIITMEISRFWQPLDGSLRAYTLNRLMESDWRTLLREMKLLLILFSLFKLFSDKWIRVNSCVFMLLIFNFFGNALNFFRSF